MNAFLKTTKILFIFVCITITLLFVPALISRKPAQEVFSQLPGYSDYGADVLGVSDEENLVDKEEKSVEVKMNEESCGCGASSNLDEEGTVGLSASIENNEDDTEITHNCVLTEEIHTSTYEVYENDGIIYIEILGSSNKGLSEAYRFLLRQGCVLADSNLEWIY